MFSCRKHSSEQPPPVSTLESVSTSGFVSTRGLLARWGLLAAQGLLAAGSLLSLQGLLALPTDDGSTGPGHLLGCLLRSSPLGWPGPHQVCALSEGLFLLPSFPSSSVSALPFQTSCIPNCRRAYNLQDPIGTSLIPHEPLGSIVWVMSLEPELRTTTCVLDGFCKRANAWLRGAPWPPL